MTSPLQWSTFWPAAPFPLGEAAFLRPGSKQATGKCPSVFSANSRSQPPAWNSDSRRGEGLKRDPGCVLPLEATSGSDLSGSGGSLYAGRQENATPGRPPPAPSAWGTNPICPLTIPTPSSPPPQSFLSSQCSLGKQALKHYNCKELHKLSGLEVGHPQPSGPEAG